MTRFKSFRLAAVLAALAMLAVACGSNDSPAVNDTGSSTSVADKGKIVVGSTNFTEQLIVAQL
jgi:glycine betaine/choline ABC-type transport system substrate-binding protein